MNTNKLQLIFKPYTGKSKKTGKDFKCYQLQIGKWQTLIFPRSVFEFEYIDSIVGNEPIVVDFNYEQ